ncbi:MAG TPA: SpoIIE family protein phosphatase [Pirellulales bacterium]|nr:SpoIIE family protein phosphatase [Pirellulales bacterium]
MAFLKLVQGSRIGHRFPLAGERSILGRHPDCDVVIEVGAVSRQHAQINHVNDQFIIEDLHSRNGTIVNGTLIQAPQRLQTGDRVRICDWTFAFFEKEPTEELSPSTAGLSVAGAMPLLLDDAATREPATIMSKLDVSSSLSFARLNANPEVKLRAMLEITHGLNRTISLDSLLPKLLDSLFKIFLQADRGFIVLSMPDGKLVPKAVKHRRVGQEDQGRISRTIVQAVMTSKQAILSADASNDARFDMAQSIADFRIRSMMCAPLVNSENNALGVIQVDTTDQRQRFTQDDLDVLVGVANQAAFAMENAQLHEMSLRQQALHRDLELAHKVQRGLLPSAPPLIDGYRFFDYYLPANQVGGDFYDYIRLTNGRLGVVLADVSGKGISAALLMAKVSSDVRYALALEQTPAAAVRRVNSNFCHSGWEDRFVTFVLTVLDPFSHEVTLVNAGHMAPLLRHGPKQVRPIGDEITGVPLGVTDGFEYEQATYQLAPGDFLTLFTDGISEAMNVNNELYGLKRLERQLAADAKDVASLGKHILDDVRRFVGGRAQSDDMCLACFGRAQ